MKVIIYGKKDCPYCEKAKTLAELINADIEYIDIIENGMGKAGLQKALNKPVDTVPQILVDDVYVGGYTDFKTVCDELAKSL